jgi:periplasmic protein TonB
MFEQAVLPAGPRSRRWAMAIGVTGEVLAVTCALIAPAIWPQLLPRPKLLTWLSLPVPPHSSASPSHVRPVATLRQMIGNKLIVPAAIPDRVAIIEDAPLSFPDAGGDVTAGELARLAIGVLDQTPLPASPPLIAQSVKPPSAEPLRRVKVGGLVKMARLIHRVDPVYPAMARQARISGTVELTGVIGIDGRIRELQVVHGHPFLAKAALEAVRQWTYEPTLLNGEAVEVIAPITVNFLLN